MEPEIKIENRHRSLKIYLMVLLVLFGLIIVAGGIFSGLLLDLPYS